MRRKDREITELNEIYSIIKKCDVCHVAFQNENYPYVIPINFGVTFENNQFKLYFHSAKEGTKLELLRKNPSVAFSMSCCHNLLYAENGSCTMEYESVCGNGVIRTLDSDEKLHALKIIMDQYHEPKEYSFPENVVAMVEVLELTVDEITGKRLSKKTNN